MENASKALMMAASILLSLLIIGALIMMFNSIKNLKASEASVEEVQTLAKYNKEMESFNRNLYGSELLSLANLITDYNIKQADVKDYKPVTLEIRLKTSNQFDNMTEVIYDNITIVEAFAGIESRVEDYQNGTTGVVTIGDITKTVQQISGMRRNDLEELIRQHDPHCPKRENYPEGAEGASQFQEEIRTYIDEKIEELMGGETQNYTNLRTEMLNFKNTIFSKVEIAHNEQYDKNTGRIIKMVFEQY